jgi:hypothetical protein
MRQLSHVGFPDSAVPHRQTEYNRPQRLDRPASSAHYTRLSELLAKRGHSIDSAAELAPRL